MEKIPFISSNSPIEIWLDSNMKCEFYDGEIEIYKSEYNNLSCYYNIDDIELTMIDYLLKDTYKKYLENNSYLDLTNNEDKEIYNRMKYMQHYTLGDKSKYIYINPVTNRYIVDMLFRKLLDNSQDLVSPNNVPLITKDMRKSFYKFCYDHSKH